MRTRARAATRGSWLAALAALATCALLVAAPRAARAGERALSHGAAMRLAVARNLGLLVRGLERERTAALAETARRPYVPEASVDASVLDAPGRDRRAAAVIVPSFAFAIPQGTSLVGSATFVEGLGANPTRDRALVVELSQAILRGGAVGGGADLKQADASVRVARELFRAEVNALLVRADRAYWDLAFAREDVGLAQRSRDRAAAQFEETRENIRRGLLAPGEIFIVEESLVGFEGRLNRAQEALGLARSAMRRLLDLPLAVTVRATTEVAVADAAEPTEAESQAAARAKNPSVLATEIAVARAEFAVSGERRVAYPRLDVYGRATVQRGLALVDAGVLSPTTDPEVRAGLRVSVPLVIAPDVARVRRARTELVQRKLEARDAVRVAEQGVHDATLRLRARKQRLALAARVVDLSEKKLQVEREKYKSGLSTLADVVRFQRELDDASSGALRARVDVLTGRAELRAARGDLDAALRIVVR